MADETDGTDAEVLATLQSDAHCPLDVLSLARQAIAEGTGVLTAAHLRARDDAFADTAGSSKSSNTITPARVPDPDSTLPNFWRTYYARLRQELERALGRPLSVSLFGEG